MSRKLNTDFYYSLYNIYYNITKNNNNKTWSKSNLINLLKQKSTICIVSKNPNQGILIARNLFLISDIILFEVKVNYRRKGVGEYLLTELFKQSLAKYAKKIILEVAEDNYPAISLYKKLGFEKNGLRKNYYDRGIDGKIDAIMMEKALF